jgi:hypothetical protein
MRSHYVPVDEMRFKLKGLEVDAIYAVKDLDKTGSEKVSGRDLMEIGLLIKIPPTGSAVIFYSHLSAVATTGVTHGAACGMNRSISRRASSTARRGLSKLPCME